MRRCRRRPIVVDDAMRGAVVTFRDITQARLAEDVLRRSEKLAAVGQLASSIAHEINNPLEAVINLLYLLRTAQSMNDVKTYALMRGERTCAGLGHYPAGRFASTSSRLPPRQSI